MRSASGGGYPRKGCATSLFTPLVERGMSGCDSDESFLRRSHDAVLVLNSLILVRVG